MASQNYFISPQKAYTPAIMVGEYPVEYFSGLDVSVFFGDQYIDEIFDISFTLEERVLPIFSYAGYKAKRIVHGTRLVQGTFSINMRSGDYLHELMYRDVDLSVRGQGGGQFPVLPVMNQQPSVPGNNLVMPNPATDPDAWSAWTRRQQQIYWASVEQSVVEAPDLGQSPYFNNQDFSIVLVYGDVDAVDITRHPERVRTIEEVNLFSVEQHMDLSGQNNRETFGFVATDINGFNRQRSIFGYAGDSPSLISQGNIKGQSKPPGS